MKIMWLRLSPAKYQYWFTWRKIFHSLLIVYSHTAHVMRSLQEYIPFQRIDHNCHISKFLVHNAVNAISLSFTLIKLMNHLQMSVEYEVTTQNRLKIYASKTKVIRYHRLNPLTNNKLSQQLLDTGQVSECTLLSNGHPIIVC